MPRKAGRALRAEYDQRLKQWQYRIRTRFVLAFGIPLWLLTTALILTDGTWRTIMAVGVGIFAGAAIWAWLSPPGHIAQLQAGSFGEEWTERELNRLRSPGWHVVHDRSLGYGNLDHVAVSPTGVVFLCDSKNLDGTVTIEDGVLHLKRYETEGRPKPWPDLRRHASSDGARLHDALRAATGIWTWVFPVVVVWATFPQRAVPAHAARGTVAFVEGEGLAEWLSSQRQPGLTEDERARVTRWLDELPSASWQRSTA